MKKNIIKSALCVLMSAVLISSVFTPATAAKKAVLVTKKMTLKTGQKQKIIIKNISKKAKYIYKSSDTKKATVSVTGKVIARKTGSLKVTVSEKLRKNKRKLGVVKVTVIKYAVVTSQPATETIRQATASPVVTAAPNTSAPVPATPAPTRSPLVIMDHNTPQGFDQSQSSVKYGTIQKVTYHSNTTGTDRKANILTPADYSTDKLYPVLYLFHGGNGDEDDWFGGNPANIIGNLIATGEAKDMIVVMPNCRARADDSKEPKDSLTQDHMDAWTNFLNDFTNDLMPYIENNYPVLKGRENTAIAGFSMGGRTSLYLGFSVPDKVAYIGAFSPAFGIFEYENWDLHENGYFTEDTFTFPQKYMDNTTCLIMSGEDDDMVRTEPERYHNTLVANNVNHYYYTMPGKHEMNVWKNGLYNFTKIVFD